MNILNRLVDANLFTLKMPNAKDGSLVVGTIHPFDLGGLGYEARIYQVFPERIALSPAAATAGLSGWGIDDVSISEHGCIEVSRDEEFSLKIWVALPCTIQVKRKYLSSHPTLPEDGPPQELVTLLNSTDSRWQTHRCSRLPATNLG